MGDAVAPEPTPARWALHEGEVTFPETGARYRLSRHEVGRLPVPSGVLLVGDTLDTAVRVPPGDLLAVVTRAATPGGTFDRVSHLSLLVPGRREVRRGPLRPADLAVRSDADPSAVVGVDSGTLHALDEEAHRRCRDVDAQWNMELADETAAGAGIGPFFEGAAGGPSALFCHAGLGDGIYEVSGGFDADGSLAALHVDFDVLDDRPAPATAGARFRERVGCAVLPLLLLLALPLLLLLVPRLRSD